jgi:preprotein translocase subunit SecA
MDHLRQGIHLRSYAQKNPKQEYKRESFELFQSLLQNLKKDVVRVTSHVKIQTKEESEEIERKRKEELERQLRTAKTEHADMNGMGGEETSQGQEAKQEPTTRDGRKVGRNDRVRSLSSVMVK